MTQSALRSVVRSVPPQKSESLLDRVSSFWNRLSWSVKVGLVALVTIAVLGSAGLGAWRQATRAVPLYPAMTADDVAQISPRLLAMGIRFNVEGGAITVDPLERPRVVGALLAYGFPRWRPAPAGSGSFTLTEDQRREQARVALRGDLAGQIQQFECVAFADVNITAGEPDAVPAIRPRASVLVGLRPAARVSRGQVQAIVALVASAVPGLDPADVKVVDSGGRVWNEGLRALVDDDGGAVDDDHVLVKRAYEALYRGKLREALDRAVGADSHVCTVNADLDFSRVKVVETHVGDAAGGGERIVLQSDVLTEKLDRGKDQGGGPYEKRHVREKADVTKSERTAVIDPGAVQRLSASVIVDGARSEAELEALRVLARGAMGHEAEVEVRCLALHRESPLAVSAPRTAPPAVPASPLPWLLPSFVGLALAAVGLARTRRPRETRGLELTAAAAAPQADLADLVTGKAGATDRAVPPTTVLESLARERPIAVAERLRDTWMAERDR